MSLEELAADFDTVEVSVGDRVENVATVAVSRPDARNALNAQVRDELKEVLAEVPETDIRVVVLTGAAGSGAFVAGADVSELRERGMLEQREVSKRPRVYECVDDCPIAGVSPNRVQGRTRWPQAPLQSTTMAGTASTARKSGRRSLTVRT